LTATSKCDVRERSGEMVDRRRRSGRYGKCNNESCVQHTNIAMAKGITMAACSFGCPCGQCRRLAAAVDIRREKD